ncbi:cytochrome bd ubiquinol oxidase subunit I [Alicyclobacillus hesperidum URH17-3-68]|uniref:Uncharacterized protein n=1 Tax=Alicyclobacillus hesperidum TaxID=89784 RepID=A0A1H2U5K7_9BACL|nr:hypothetical protein [Alicyclobacillus hesperidum]EJY57088.1 cytochrome bd ubiquinol oxidase subunit I [Alicyclobacillus hesperidum URH17-3-68]GLV14092.1 hypothetical protein Heshes_17760 [Alicyclobacillus hesperidum]SDW51512.1 hypothetical protein SAMN04489725_10763 [Alicyclobacillus hesperidum]
MVWWIRVVTALMCSATTWGIARVVGDSVKIACVLGFFVLAFGLLSTVRKYLLQHRFLRRDLLSQYIDPMVASAIVAAIVRLVRG